MKISIENKPLNKVASDILIVGLFEGAKTLPEELKEIDKATGALISDYLIKKEKFEAKQDETSALQTYGKIPAKTILVVGLGKEKEFTSAKLRITTSKLAQKLSNDKKIKTIAMTIPTTDEKFYQAAAEGAGIGEYSFEKYKSKKKHNQDFSLVVSDKKIFEKVKKSVEKAVLIVEGMNLAKDMVNEPAQTMTPQAIADIAKSLSGVVTKVYEKPEIEKLGMGAFLGVAQGSVNPPKFIHMKYSPKTPKTTNAKKIVLIGKAVTFDSGGLDLKPPSSMLSMKDDMSASAALTGLMSIISRLKPNKEVHALIAACENMPSGSAFKPGDVLTAMNGKTIEIDNTDAEGRLTLADAVCFAQKELGADEIIDMATLTGACVVALGDIAFAVMGNNKQLNTKILSSAENADELAWELPMFDEYKNSLKSDIADMKNTGSRFGGASIAAKFIENFVEKKTKWAHIDIAGTAYIEKNIRENTKGATASPLRTIVSLLEAN